MKIPPLFRLAKNISKHSEYRVRVGALLCDHKYNPISVGFNKDKSHPKYSAGLKPTIHAECAAIISSSKESIDNGIIFVYREDKRGNLALARPCENCLKVLSNFGVTRIYYTTNEYPYWDTEEIE